MGHWGRAGGGQEKQGSLREGSLSVSWVGRVGSRIIPSHPGSFLYPTQAGSVRGFAGKLIFNSHPIIHYNWKQGDASEMMLILESECQPGLLISEIHTSLRALKLLLDWNFYKLNSKSNITELPNVTELLIKGIYHSPLNQNIKVHFHLKVTETLWQFSLSSSNTTSSCEGSKEGWGQGIRDTKGLKIKQNKNSNPSKLSMRILRLTPKRTVFYLGNISIDYNKYSS